MIVLTVLVAIGGTTLRLDEETIAIFPILIPVFLAAKYDAMVGLASICIGLCIGTISSTVNLFAIIIASGAAGINWNTVVDGRIITLIIGTLICVLYIMRYAKRLRKGLSKSVIYVKQELINQQFKPHSHKDNLKLTICLRLILVLFIFAFVVMIYGVSHLQWWFAEMGTVYLNAAVVIANIAKIKEYAFVEVFIRGANYLM